MSTLSNIWNRLLRVGSESNFSYDGGIETMFVNQACYLGSFFTALIAIATKIIFPESNIYLSIFVFSAFFWGGIILNYFKLYVISKLFLFSFIQLVVCWGSCTFGRAAGIQNFSLVLLLSPFVYYKAEEKLQKALSFLIPVAGIVSLYISDFQLFENQIHINSEGFQIFESVILIFTLISYFFIIIGFKRNISSQSISIQKKNQELIDSINRTNTLNENLDKFVYTVSHDLRSPISSALGLIELSKTETDIETIREYLAIQEKSMRRMNDFVGDMLAYYKNSKSINYYENIDLGQLIEDVIQSNQTLITEANINIETKIEQTDKFRSDPMKLRIIFNNLVSNAIRYIDEEKEKHHILIEIKTDSKHADINVTDNGIGIAAESQEKVFDMFYRATFKKSGTGLGLFMVRELLTKLLGSIKLESEEKVYTKFIVTIPNQIII